MKLKKGKPQHNKKHFSINFDLTYSQSTSHKLTFAHENIMPMKIIHCYSINSFRSQNFHTTKNTIICKLQETAANPKWLPILQKCVESVWIHGRILRYYHVRIHFVINVWKDTVRTDHRYCVQTARRQ